jgi:hypothetical protein
MYGRPVIRNDHLESCSEPGVDFETSYYTTPIEGQPVHRVLPVDGRRRAARASFTEGVQVAPLLFGYCLGWQSDRRALMRELLEEAQVGAPEGMTNSKSELNAPPGRGAEQVLVRGVLCYSVIDEGRLARHALPLAILLNPDIGKAPGVDYSPSLRSYLILVHPGRNGNVPVQVNRHSAAGELLVMIDSVSDMSQPLAFVHKAPIVVREIKGFRKQSVESLRIMCDFGLIPSVLKGQNPSGLIDSLVSLLSSDCETRCHQKDTASTRASH